MIDTIDRELATSCSAVPTMMIAMDEELERGGGSLESLELVVTGGSPVPPDLARRWTERFGTRFTITYGLTESSPVITQSDPTDTVEHQIGTCGLALPHVEFDIVDVVTRERVPVGQPGELRTRGWLVMNGYWDNPQATAEAIEDGFLRSGDLATVDADGYVRIVGRFKDVIIRGGENIYAKEVEQAIRLLPQVLDVALVGADDERYGELPVAFVRLHPGRELTYEQLVAELRPRLARFKIPARLIVLDAFPTTPSGKVQKFKLKELMCP
jgi:acyl-CoA synthetase (AMP-forming)/AMP-acid ligase II